MSADIEEMAERIRAGLDPAPVCPYVKVHGPNARCPNCQNWPRPDPARVAEKTARLAESASVGTEGFARSLRAPIVPGLNLDPGEPPRRSRWRGGGIWALRFAMVAAGASIMYAEGQRQPQPGIGFAIAMALIMGAAFIGSRPRD